MMLFSGLAAKYGLDARLPDGRRLETDTLVDAEYTLEIGGLVVLRKRLEEGLTIEHSDALGDGFLFVHVDNGELSLTGKARQRLVYTDCQGNRFGAILRPEYVYIED